MTTLKTIWIQVRDSLWFVPAFITCGSAVCAFGMVELDRRLAIPDHVRSVGFVFAAGAEGARGVLSTIAGSFITVTGVVFSVTIVALQLASTQFTPRVLRSFMEDRANQLVLGVFIGTFTYALLVLRTVRSPIEDNASFVPMLAVTGAMILSLVSIGFLIFFINHIARSIQAEVVIERVTRDAISVVDDLFPEQLGAGARLPPEARHEQNPPPAGEPRRIAARRSGYLQAVDEDALLRIAVDKQLLVQMEKEIGDFVLEDDIIALVWPRDNSGVEEAMSSVFRIGPDRTRYQDVERGIIELTDIGVRALSPSINDPTTAIVCIDRLTEVMTALGTRCYPSRFRKGENDEVRVIARHGSYEQALHLAFARLRHHGCREPAVALRLIESLVRLRNSVALDRRRLVTAELRDVVLAAEKALAGSADWPRIQKAARANEENGGMYGRSI